MYHIYKKKISNFLYMTTLKIIFFPVILLWKGLKAIYYLSFPPFCDEDGEDNYDEGWEEDDFMIENDNTVIDEIRKTFENVEIGTIFTTNEIKSLVSKKFGRNEGSVIPSDCCYNMTNKGIIGTSFEHFNIFMQIRRGEYEYVGEEYSFDKDKTTAIGYINKNNQRNNGRKEKSTNHYNQWFYEMECLDCGYVYNANGADIWLRKCPQCQQSKKAHKTSREIPDGLRYKILKRDNFKCCACGASPAKDPSVELHIDHIVPWSKGGETVIENLQVLCSKCNIGKSNSL